MKFLNDITREVETFCLDLRYMTVVTERLFSKEYEYQELLNQYREPDQYRWDGRICS